MLKQIRKKAMKHLSIEFWEFVKLLSWLPQKKTAATESVFTGENSVMSGYLNLYQNLPGPWTTRWFCVYFGIGSILSLPTSPSACFTGRTLHSHIPQTWLCVFLEKGCSHPGYLNSTHAASVFFWTCSKFPRQSQQPAPSRLLEMLRFSRSSKLQCLIILSAEALEIQISWCAESPLLYTHKKTRAATIGR